MEYLRGGDFDLLQRLGVHDQVHAQRLIFKKKKKKSRSWVRGVAQLGGGGGELNWAVIFVSRRVNGYLCEQRGHAGVCEVANPVARDARGVGGLEDG